MNLHLPYRSIHFKEIDSTNDYLKRHPEIKGPIIVTTDYQSKGRGRLNHVWESKPGVNLLVSIKKENVENPLYETLKMAYSILLLLESYELSPQIKWPNDIYVENKKISGILSEVIHHSLIIGVGLNINDQENQSLYLLTNKTYSIDAILQELLNIYTNLSISYEMLIHQLNQYSYLKGKIVNGKEYGRLLLNGSIEVKEKDKISYQYLNEIHIHQHLDN